MAQLAANRNLRALFGKNLQHSSRNRRFQFVAHFVCFEFNDCLANLNGIAFMLEPAQDAGLGCRNSACLRNLQRGNDVTASLATGAKAPFEGNLVTRP